MLLWIAFSIICQKMDGDEHSLNIQMQRAGCEHLISMIAQALHIYIYICMYI